MDSHLRLTLADGRHVRLVGLEAWGKPLPPALLAPLQSQLAGAQAQLVAMGLPDRWNTQTVTVFMDTQGTPDLLALSLLRQGLARALPEAAAKPCWAALVAAEAEARAAGLGLWQDPDLAVLNGQDGRELSARAGQIVVVEGVVFSAHEYGPRLYLNMGPKRGVDLALVVRKSQLRKLEQAATAAHNLPWTFASLVGKAVRVRGLVERAFGPHLEIIDTDQIEDLDSPVADTMPAGVPH